MKIPLNEAAVAAASEEDRKWLAEQLAVFEEVLAENPLQGFRPHPKQVPYFESRAPITAFFGGNRAGKTTALVVWFLVQAVDEICLPDHLKPYKQFGYKRPFTGRIICPDFSATLEGVILPKLREWAPKAQLHKGSFDRAWEKQIRVLRFANGAWIQFMTYEQDVDKFGGSALDAIGYDEEPPEDIRKESRMRLIDYGGVERFAMTPLMGMSWMYDSIYERRFEDGFEVIVADMDDNPHLDEQAKAQALDGLTDEELKARKQGLFVHFAGLVYDEFTDAKHVIEKVKPEFLRDKDIVVGIDPGIRWTGIAFLAFDSDNSATLFDELLLSGEDAIPGNAAKSIRAILGYWSIPRADFVIDPSARNRVGTNGDQIEAAYQRAGIYAAHGQNAVEAGVFEVKRRLQHDPPMLRVGRNCQRFLWERGRYRIDPKEDGSFAVIKRDDHISDSLRYACMERSWWTDNPLPQRKRVAYQQNYEPPYTGEGPNEPSPPLGYLS